LKPTLFQSRVSAYQPQRYVSAFSAQFFNKLSTSYRTLRVKSESAPKCTTCQGQHLRQRSQWWAARGLSECVGDDPTRFNLLFGFSLTDLLAFTVVKAIFLSLFIFILSNSFAQNSLEQLRTQVANGYYASATKISGPLAIKENPDNPEAYFLFSQALYYAAEIPEARVQLDKALTLLSDEPPPSYIHLNGLITASEGQLTQAVTLLETAFLRSQDYSVAMDWGDTAWQAGDFDTALEAFQAATTTERGKTELWPYLNQGRILQQAKEDLDGAMTAYQTVLDIFDANYPGGAPAPPSVVEANFRLGEIYESLGDKATAKSYYDAALYLDRNYTPAKNALDRLVRNP
jgi:tetratricopeptide (TPR) repeat protein